VTERLILVVDDNDDNVDMLARWLKRRSFAVVTACNGLEGVKTAIDRRPDLVFMDISMPVMSGMEATALIRATPAIAGTPVVALTAHAMGAEQAACIDAGCNAVLTKPIDFDDLTKCLSIYLPVTSCVEGPVG
jgi:CheY-like chemotaxis protein